MLRCSTFDKKKDEQNVIEKVYIKFNLESAHKLLWRGMTYRVFYFILLFFFNHDEACFKYKHFCYLNNFKAEFLQSTFASFDSLVLH